MTLGAAVADHVVPLLIGRDPARIEDIWQYLYRGAYWRRGPVTMTAIAAVGTALWAESNVAIKLARLDVSPCTWITAESGTTRWARSRVLPQAPQRAITLTIGRA